MQRLYRTVVQLEEAKRFILDGDVERLRLALILLDNAVEAIMSRFIDERLSDARMYARLLEKVPAGPLDIKGEALRRNIKANVIPSRRQRKIERSFDEKLTFLSNDCRRLPPSAAQALSHLHKYRNETQHHDLIREGSIRPALLVPKISDSDLEDRGRNAGYPAPPAQIRTCALTHTAPTFGG